MTYDIPGSGGKRMARMPRKMSVEHMVVVEEETALISRSAGDFEVVQLRVEINSTV
jgi:hypothetical protein